MISEPIIQVAIPAPLRRLFNYLPPLACNPRSLISGVRVKVPFGARNVVGIIVGTTKSSAHKKLKRIADIIDERPIFNASLLHLCHFVSDYYHAPLGEVFDCAMPSLLRAGRPADLLQTRLWRCSSEPMNFLLLKRSPQQKNLIHYLLEHREGVSDLQLIEAGFSRPVLAALFKRGWVECFHKVAAIDPKHFLSDTAPTLNAEQVQAVSAIVKAANTFKVFLLDGVTGSGKTEVYLQAITAVLAEQKQALVLVPEIGLTPQTVERFKARFQVNVVALHSGLTEQERLQAWVLASEGRANIIIGTRSAVFIPMQNPGIIIIDEEHDGSFKQQEGVRYHARDCAIVRAQFEKIPIVLGSATPSLETFYNARQHRFEHLILTERAGTAVHARWSLLDLRQKKITDGLSPALILKIKEHLTKDAAGQVLIFLNRRGYAPTLMCYNCGWMAVCQRCNARMTFHQLPLQLHCHHCDSQARLPSACPDCHQKNVLHPVGAGTERIEAILQKEFAKFGIVRVDRDSTSRKGSLQKLFHAVHTGKSRILLGTQMIAKGHHFPNVTLVAVLDADASFFSTDFRAVERGAQLLLQVAGRAGRAEKPGEVVVQTMHPEHPLLHQLITEPYKHVLETLLMEREQCSLPPFTYFALLRAEAMKDNIAIDFLKEVQQSAIALNVGRVRIMTPVFAPMPKRAGRIRAQLLFSSGDRKSLHLLLKAVCVHIEATPSSRRVRWSLDVDPMEMM